MPNTLVRGTSSFYFSSIRRSQHLPIKAPPLPSALRSVTVAVVQNRCTTFLTLWIRRAARYRDLQRRLRLPGTPNSPGGSSGNLLATVEFLASRTGQGDRRDRRSRGRPPDPRLQQKHPFHQAPSTRGAWPICPTCFRETGNVSDQRWGTVLWRGEASSARTGAGQCSGAIPVDDHCAGARRRGSALRPSPGSTARKAV